VDVVGYFSVFLVLFYTVGRRGRASIKSFSDIAQLRLDSPLFSYGN